MSDKPDSAVRLFSYADDQPHEARGALIPRPGQKTTFTPHSVRRSPGITASLLVALLGIFTVGVAGTAGYGLLAKSNLAAAPSVTIVNPYTQNATALEYGPQVALAQSNFFIETRDAFIDEGLTFIEVDMTGEQLRFFKKGVLLISAEIYAIGEVGSWWDTPSGLYQIEQKDERPFTNIGQAYLPWQLTFQGNFIIHGTPEYPDGSLVSLEESVGGIRLSNEMAKEVYRQVQLDTPVLVHALEEEERDTFVYEPQVPDIDIPHYLVADIQNGTILATSDLDETAPIASVTKLMTAVVAAENIDLDSRVRVVSPSFVTSLIPRLSERSSVSMYSLLQLLLVESSNEAAETIAGQLGRDAFIEAMNAKARQLGMLQTTFVDPSGLMAGNRSSVGDLYRLANYIHEHRKFIFDITANQELATAHIGGEFGTLINFNGVEDVVGFAGGKVGETTAAGMTSVSLHRVTIKDEERLLVVIIMGSDSRTEDITTLLEHVSARFDR